MNLELVKNEIVLDGGIVSGQQIISVDEKGDKIIIALIRRRLKEKEVNKHRNLRCEYYVCCLSTVVKKEKEVKKDHGDYSFSCSLCKNFLE